MVKFRWFADKVRLQRMIILGIIGVISCGILKGHMNYEREVSEYMQSLEYRRAKEASQDYQVKQMKQNQRLLVTDDVPTPIKEE